MASIDFTHATYGALTLTSSWVGDLARFQNWVPSASSVGPSGHELGTGRLHRYEHRVEYGASFELAGLNNYGDVGKAIALKEHLEAGGTCTVTTDDTLGSTYPVCGLGPDGECVITFEDRQMLEYRIRLALINVDVTPVPMSCVY